MRVNAILAGSLVAGCALLVGTPRIADAQPSGPKANVTVLHGTTCAVKKVDADVGEAPPVNFPCWKVAPGFKKQLNLVPGAPAAMQLPNGRTFQLAYNGATNEKPPRFKVAASISKPDGSGYNPLADFTAEPGKDFDVGGFQHEGGILVIRIRIVP